MPAIYSCLVCGYRFTNKDCLVKCDGCSQRVHDKCSKLSMEELKYLSSRNRILKFFCESCELDSSSIIELGQLNLQQSVNGFNKKNVITRRNSTKSIVINEVSWCLSYNILYCVYMIWILRIKCYTDQFTLNVYVGVSID